MKESNYVCESRISGVEREGMEAWLLRRVAEAAGVPLGEVRADERFTRYGLDSLALTRLISEASRHLGRSLAPTLAWSCPTPADMARHLSDPSAAAAAAEDAGRATGEDVNTADESIAVIGMAARFPGAPSTSAFWDLLVSGRDAVTSVPGNRWSAEDWYDPDPGKAGRMSTRWGGFLDEIADFDPLFFGIAPAEAVQMDPQQRLMLELAWESLEDAGIPPTSLRGRAAGVFVGAMWTDYGALVAADPALMTTHSATGGDTSVISARISYTLGLTGPSLTVNTACSSSLVALHQARRSLLSGECDLVLAGGVNLLCTPPSTVSMSRFGAMAPDGRCKAFDARANGYVRGEGGGLVVLKPLSRARADGDRVYCVVRGSAVNNDGFSNGLTAPSPQAQEAVLRRACADAGVAPSAVQLVETHGTGTMLGDPIEAGALGAVHGQERPADSPLQLGAVKTNIGHLEAAAGVAGFIKTALALHHRTIPGNLHFETPNPHIPFEALHLEVPTTTRAWPGSPAQEPLAGVSGFGFGGTNCHVLLAGTPQEEATTSAAAGLLPQPGASGLRPARTGQPEGPVFVFGGQGSQWPRMGAELMAEPAFARAVRACDRALTPHLGRSVKDALALRREPLTDTSSIQAAVFTMQVALAALWTSRGVRPAAVVGQSMGEIAAGYVSGALSLEDAARIVSARTRLVEEGARQGAMVTVALDAERTRQAVVRHGDPDLAIAVVNGAHRTVVSGGRSAVHEFSAMLTAEQVTVRRIDVDYASHSPHMDPLLPLLRRALTGLTPGPPVVPMWSTVTGERVDGDELDADYWCRNLRETVSFGPVIEELAAQGRQLFLDVNPHPVTVSDIAQILDGGVVLPSMRRGERALTTLGESAAGLREAEARPASPDDGSLGGSAPGPYLLALSGRDENALARTAELMARRLETDSTALPDICHTAAAHRSHHEHRLALTVTESGQAAAALDSYARGERPSGLVRGRARSAAARTVFVFPGQGGQHAAMGTSLYREEPAFRRAAHSCAELILAEGQIDLLPWLRAEQPLETDAIEVVQPAVFTMGVGLAALWRSWGVEPAAVVGHSMGEAAAAYACGALSLPDAVRVICRRSAALARLAGQGAMLLVELDRDAAIEKAVAPYGEALEVAAVNGPRATVVTGDADAVRQAAEALGEQGIMARVLQVDAPAHSSRLDPLLAGLRRGLVGLSPAAERVPFISTVTGDAHPGEALDAGYWARNLREPVRFTDAIGRLSADGPVCFLELGPHPVLAPAIQDVLREANTTPGTGSAVGALHRNMHHRDSLTGALASLYAHGAEIDWDRTLLPPGRLVGLPHYPWQRQRYWIADGTAPAAATAEEPGREPLASRVAAAAPDEAAALVRHHLAAQLTPLLGLHVAEIPPDKPLASLGTTSLTAMQLRNFILEDLNVDLRVSQILGAPGLAALVEEILQAETLADPVSSSPSTEVLL